MQYIPSGNYQVSDVQGCAAHQDLIFNRSSRTWYHFCPETLKLGSALFIRNFGAGLGISHCSYGIFFPGHFSDNFFILIVLKVIFNWLTHEFTQCPRTGCSSSQLLYSRAGPFLSVMDGTKARSINNNGIPRVHSSLRFPLSLTEN